LGILKQGYLEKEKTPIGRRRRRKDQLGKALKKSQVENEVY